MTDHDNLASALVAALADLTVVEKTNTARIPGKDGKQGYTYDYAAIEDVVKLTRPVLAAHGLVALTPIHDHGNGLACTVTIVHAKGERLDLGPFPFPHGRDAQATGSMVTYHRRYALVAALGIAAGDDDDGAAAQPRTKEQDLPDEVPCPKCSSVIAGGRSSREPLRAHLVAEHGFIRQDDGSVVQPPKTEDLTRPFGEEDNDLANRADRMREKVAANGPADPRLKAAGE